jgi:hypothetical protein
LAVKILIFYTLALSTAGRAQGIEAESPQDLHWQIRGLGAESPVFLSVFGQKNASGIWMYVYPLNN